MVEALQSATLVCAVTCQAPPQEGCKRTQVLELEFPYCKITDWDDVKPYRENLIGQEGWGLGSMGEGREVLICPECLSGFKEERQSCASDYGDLSNYPHYMTETREADSDDEDCPEAHVVLLYCNLGNIKEMLEALQTMRRGGRYRRRNVDLFMHTTHRVLQKHYKAMYKQLSPYLQDEHHKPTDWNACFG